MGDDFDPCECFNFHEVAMRRLLSILRQTQSHCTDEECLTTDRLPLAANPTDSSETYLFCFFLMFVFFLLNWLPVTFRSRTAEEPSCHIRDDDDDISGSSPPPAGL